MRMFLSLGFGCLFALVALGQSRHCGTELPLLSAAEQQRIYATYRAAAFEKTVIGPTDSIPITAHLVQGDTANLPLLTAGELVAEIERMNKAFEGTEMAFYLGSINRVEGGSYYALGPEDCSDAGQAEFTLCRLSAAQNVPGTINIYFIERIDNNYWGVAQFPWQGKLDERYLGIAYAYATDGATLTHEMGHYYGLFHTFEDQFGLECVDGANCQFTGDLICDTPAEPRFLFWRNCNEMETLSSFDPKGALYRPRADNFMNYAPVVCQDRFTPEQKGILHAIHKNPDLLHRPDLAALPVTDLLINTGVDEIVIQSGAHQVVDFEIWGRELSAPEAVTMEVFLLGPAQSGDRSGTLQRQVLHREKLQLPPGSTSVTKNIDLRFPITLTGGSYVVYATIDSDNELSERFEFNNGTHFQVSVDNSGVGPAFVFPNPATNILNLLLTDPVDSGPLTIDLYTSEGRLLSSYTGVKQINKAYGRVLDVSDLDVGLYFLRVQLTKAEAAYTLKFLRN